MKQLRAELKLNETQMKGTGTSVDVLEQREKLLKQELQASGDKVTFLSDKLRVASLSVFLLFPTVALLKAVLNPAFLTVRSFPVLHLHFSCNLGLHFQ